MRRRSVAVVFACATVALWVGQRDLRAQSEAAQIIDAAAAALGGKARIMKVRTLTIDGYGTNPNIGQAMTPEAEPLWWMLPDYKRRIDLEHGRMELSFTRRPAFPAVFDAQRQAQRLDRDLAYPAPRAGGAAQGAPVAGGRGGGAGQIGGAAARDQRLDMLRHPLTLVRAALDPTVGLTNPRRTAAGRSVDITTGQGDVLTLTIDGRGRPVSIRTAVYHNVLGDTERVTTFDAYEDLDGVLLPKRFVQRLDRWVEYQIAVMKNTLDADMGELEAPAAVRAAAQPQQTQAAPAPAALDMQMVSKGIWYGGASLIVEFADHVVLMEVQNEAKVGALLAKAKELVPGKPVTHAVVSHHHFDHAGGVRAAVAQGLTIVTHQVNEAWFRELVTRKHSIVADSLARAPKPLKLMAFGDSQTLRDASMEVTLYHVRGDTHGDGILMAYFPRERLLFASDEVHGVIRPHTRSLYADIRARNLAVERVGEFHQTAIVPWQEFEKQYAEWCCRPSSTTNYVRDTADR